MSNASPRIPGHHPALDTDPEATGLTVPVANEEDWARTRVRFWPKFWRVIGRIPFAEDMAAAWFCATDAKTPKRIKAVLLGAIAYFITPADLIPDIIASVGFTDEATVLMTALSLVGAHVKDRHRQEAKALMGK